MLFRSGQNVNAYAGEAPGDAWSLARLIRELAQVDGLERIRFTTSHPNDMADDLVAAFAEVPQLMPYLHLPVQSGSDRVLRAMNRRHTAAHYLRLVERLRGARPDLALTSDFIVGFPGESDADFEATLRLAALNALIDRDRRRFDLAQLGRTLPVLWERPGRRPGQLIGRSPYLQAVWAQAPAELIGRITPALMAEAGPNSLHGRLAGMTTLDHAA